MKIPCCWKMKSEKSQRLTNHHDKGIKRFFLIFTSEEPEIKIGLLFLSRYACLTWVDDWGHIKY